MGYRLRDCQSHRTGIILNNVERIMPRPTGPWTVPEQRERAIIDRITSGSIRTLGAYADAALEGGYEESGAIAVSEQKIAEAEKQLADFEALSNQELVRINKAENSARPARRGRSQRDLRRLQSLLAEALAFVPPSAAHQDFANYLVSKLQTEIAEVNIPNASPAVPLPQFIARITARLKEDIARQLVGQETDADIQWVKDLRDSL